MYCYNAFVNFFAEKVKAAILVLRYKYSDDIHSFELEKGIALILGFMNGKQKIETFNAGIGVGDDKSVDWLFY